MHIIDASELKALTQTLQSPTVLEEYRASFAADAQERHALSRARVVHWDNTILGHRRSKLTARNERAAAEEAARVAIDALTKKEEDDRRKVVVDRARRMQHNSQDAVRAFHSKVMLCEVLKERDLQLAMKRIQKPIPHTQNLAEKATANEAIQQAIFNDAKKLAAQKLARLQLAQQQQIQMREKHLKEAAVRDALLREQQELVEKDNAYRCEQLEKEKKKRAESCRLRDELLDMRRGQVERAVSAKVQSAVEDEKIRDWAARKTRQNELKKVIEQKWFDEALNRREQIGLVQARITNETDTKIEEQIAKAIKQKEELEKLEEERKYEKKQQRKEELKLYYHNYLERNAERKRIEALQEAELLRHYNKLKEEADREKIEKKEKILKTGKSLQAYHKSQVDRIVKERELEKIERLAYDKMKNESYAKEDTDLSNYMKSVAEEPWAQTNPRLKKFIQETLGRHKTVRRPRGEPVNTKERLGFLPGAYKIVELARMNPIVTGDYLKMAGEQNPAPKS